MSSKLNNLQQGFSLIMGIFLIVIMSGIALLLGKVASMQYQSSALDEMGAIAYQAAKTGIEWGAYQIVNGTCTTTLTSITFIDTLSSTMSDYSADVQCSGDSLRSVLTATACNRTSSLCSLATPDSMYVERQLTVTLCSSNNAWTTNRLQPDLCS